VNIVIYARFSSHSQNEQSIEGQLKVCYEFAERNGYKVITEYIDRALSGTSDARPEFQRMIADSAKRQFKAVLVYQLDRFARNRYDSATYKSKLKKHGVRVISARENITDDASGILIEGVLESMAEYYSVELGQKIKRGMALNAEKCLYNGSGLALGYSVDEQKRFILNKEEVPIVRKIFEMYLAGSTMADIIRYLNVCQVKTSRGNEYGKNSIRKILTNKRYCGYYKYQDTEIPNGVPRIIDDDTFAQVQTMMERNKKAPARAKAVEDNYILTTKMFCDCGAAMVGVSGTSQNGSFHQYYQCVTNRRRGNCKQKMVRKAYIEDKVIEETRKILTPEYIDKIANSVVAASEKERNTETLKRLNRLLRENETATANLIKALEAGKAVDVISTQIEKRQAEKAELEVQLAKEKLQRPQLEYGKVKFFFEKFAKGDPNNIDYRRSLVDVFIGRVELGPDTLRIRCNAQEDQKIECPIGEPDGSPMGHVVEARGIEFLSA
jgi:DNA invertase Pin-like site-specific DNA recombinase